MGTVIINDTKLKQMIRSGKTVQHCAQHFGVSVSAVRQRLKRMDIIVSRSLALDKPRTDKIVEEAFDAHSELRRIHTSASNMLDNLENVQRGELAVEVLEPLLGSKASVGDLQLKCIAELRKQLSFMHDVHRHMCDLKTVQEFQLFVLREISAADPEVGHRIKRRLIEASMIESSLSWT